jgi:hypothetical protein
MRRLDRDEWILEMSRKKERKIYEMQQDSFKRF